LSLLESKDMNKLDKIKSEFERIKRLGFIKSTRQKNKDGGIGNTFEDYLGVDENNLSDPDFEGFEVKTKRFMNSSVVSLFSKSPTYPKGANRLLKEKYGEVRDPEFPDLKKLYASIYGGKLSNVYGKFKMTLVVDYVEKRLYLHIFDQNNDLDKEVYWSFEELEKGISKLKKLFIVFAESKDINGLRYYHYNSGNVYLDLNFKSFLEEIEEGNIQFDLRIGVHKSGKNYGKPHDHGSGFRIRKENIDKLYKTKLIL
jgi:hypothetical protein